MTLRLPDFTHQYETLSCNATMRIVYTYQPREESDGETPVYPESVEIDSVECVAVDMLDEAGDVFFGFTGPLLRPGLNDSAVARFRVEVDDDRLQAMCLEDARNF